MKVKIGDLQPNPFRDIENYMIDQVRVEALKASIESTEFWDNILARTKDGKIQIAYGHHRLEALKQLYPPDHEVDIPVKDLTDEQMLQIMANENITMHSHELRVMLSTVRRAKVYLEEHPEVRAKLDASNRNGPAAGNRTVGKVLITKFLNGHKGRRPQEHSLWSESTVGESLAVIADAAPEVIEKAPSLRQAYEISRDKDHDVQKKTLKVVLDGTLARNRFGKRRRRPLNASETRRLVAPQHKKGNGRRPYEPRAKDTFSVAVLRAKMRLTEVLDLMGGDIAEGWPQADDRDKDLVRDMISTFRKRTEGFLEPEDIRRLSTEVYGGSSVREADSTAAAV